VPDVQRPALYSLFLKGVLMFDQVDLIALSQHAIGLGLAVGVYVLLLHHEVRRWLAALVTAPLLLDPLQIASEHTILTETVFQALALGALALLAWPGKRSGLVSGGVGALLAAATATRTVGLALVLPALAYMLLRKYGAVRLAAFATGLTVVLAAYAGWFHGAHGRYALQDWEGHFLYGRVAPFADCSRLGPLPRLERPLCRREAVRYRPTWYVFHPDSPIASVRPPRDESVDDLAGDFARRVIKGQPGAYLRTVAGDFARYFQPFRRTGPLEDPLAETQFQPNAIASREPERATSAIRRLEHDPDTGPVVLHAVAGFITRWQDLAYVPGPFFALGLLAGVFGSLLRPLGTRDRRLEAMLFSFAAVTLLLLPVATVVFDYRHLVPALPFVALAAGFGADALVSLVGSRTGRPIPASSRGRRVAQGAR